MRKPVVLRRQNGTPVPCTLTAVPNTHEYSQNVAFVLRLDIPGEMGGSHAYNIATMARWDKRSAIDHNIRCGFIPASDPSDDARGCVREGDLTMPSFMPAFHGTYDRMLMVFDRDFSTELRPVMGSLMYLLKGDGSPEQHRRLVETWDAWVSMSRLLRQATQCILDHVDGNRLVAFRSDTIIL